MTKRLFVLFLATLLLITSSLIISPVPARADERQNSYNTQETVCIYPEKLLEDAKNLDNNIFENEDLEAIAAIGAATGASAGLGSITVLTTTTTAHGILALLGAGTTTVVALPVAGIVATGGLLTYGGYKVIKYIHNQEKQGLLIANNCL